MSDILFGSSTAANACPQVICENTRSMAMPTRSGLMLIHYNTGQKSGHKSVQ